MRNLKKLLAFAQANDEEELVYRFMALETANQYIEDFSVFKQMYESGLQEWKNVRYTKVNVKKEIKMQLPLLWRVVELSMQGVQFNFFTPHQILKKIQVLLYPFEKLDTFRRYFAPHLFESFPYKGARYLAILSEVVGFDYSRYKWRRNGKVVDPEPIMKEFRKQFPEIEYAKKYFKSIREVKGEHSQSSNRKRTQYAASKSGVSI